MVKHLSWLMTLFILLAGFFTEAMSSPASFSRHMNEFIRVVEHVENENPSQGPVAVLGSLRQLAGPTDGFLKAFLSNTASCGQLMDSSLSDYITSTINHTVTEDNREEGVVLTSDGTTVALRPLLLGIEAGFLSEKTGRVPGLYHLTLARDLGHFFRHFISLPLPQNLGPDGCWDNLTFPQIFTLSEKPIILTTALINGGMDGVILGKELSASSSRPPKLSSLLRSYYCHHLERDGLASAPRLISRRRRENFRELVKPPLLTVKVSKCAIEQLKIKEPTELRRTQKKELRAHVKKGLKEFFHQFVDCPSIIPRCMWDAEPYRGTPTPLSPPLSSMYIHHTHTPSQPCLTFEQCSADMRSMQRFHQDDRGWDDIGYSFVAGSDGHIYLGRGWQWQGAHTLGHNSIGYGVAFIGDYSTRLPSQHAMELVRDRLASCAIQGGHLVGNFTLQGHRQVVNTSCPGNALYDEITSWKHFVDA